MAIEIIKANLFNDMNMDQEQIDFILNGKELTFVRDNMHAPRFYVCPTAEVAQQRLDPIPIPEYLIDSFLDECKISKEDLEIIGEIIASDITIDSSSPNRAIPVKLFQEIKEIDQAHRNQSKENIFNMFKEIRDFKEHSWDSLSAYNKDAVDSAINHTYHQNIYIQKYPKQKDAIRINSEQDIPDELKDTIRIEGDKIICLAAEGYNESPLGSVIGFDRKAPTETGKGAWPLGEGSFIEKDGMFFPAPEIRTAELIKTTEQPFILHTEYGTEELKEGEQGFLVTRPNGSQNILTIGTTSASDYMVCTKDGKELCSLDDYCNENIIKKEPIKEDDFSR